MPTAAQRAANTEYHRKRREADPTYAERRRANTRAWKKRHVAHINGIIGAAKDKPCVDCGNQFPSYCMEFDHVRGCKSFSLSKVARSGVSEAAVLEELAKCDVRCALCHRARHNGDPSPLAGLVAV